MDNGDRARFFEEVASLSDGPDDFEEALNRSLQGGRFAEAYRAHDRIVLDDSLRRDGLHARLIGEMDRQVEAETKRLGSVRKRLNDLLKADDRQVLSVTSSPTSTSSERC